MTARISPGDHGETIVEVTDLIRSNDLFVEITVRQHRRSGRVTVNWPALGDVDATSARSFADALLVAADEADRLSEGGQR